MKSAARRSVVSLSDDTLRLGCRRAKTTAWLRKADWEVLYNKSRSKLVLSGTYSTGRVYIKVVLAELLDDDANRARAAFQTIVHAPVPALQRRSSRLALPSHNSSSPLPSSNVVSILHGNALGLEERRQ